MLFVSQFNFVYERIFQHGTIRDATILVKHRIFYFKNEIITKGLNNSVENMGKKFISYFTTRARTHTHTLIFYGILYS